MKKIVLIAWAFMLAVNISYAQYTISLSGLNTTGWTVGAPTGNGSHVIGDTVYLNSFAADTSGYVYHSTPFDLTDCGEFTATFDFRITTNQPFSPGPGDGMAFWIFDAAQLSSTPGFNMGMQAASVGEAFIIDTYDDDLDGNNTVLSFYHFNGGNYNEGISTPGVSEKIATDVVNHNAANGVWNTCVINYRNGYYNISVNNAPVVTNLLHPLTAANSAYFGFSSSTTSNGFSEHAIRNVVINIDTVAKPLLQGPIINDTIRLCQTDTLIYDSIAKYVQGDSLIWWDTIGGVIVGPPVVRTDRVDTFEFYVSNYITPCGVSPLLSVVVRIDSTPLPASISTDTSFCVGDLFTPINTIPDRIWYSDTNSFGTTIPPIISTAVPDTFRYWITRRKDFCESRFEPVTFYVLPTPKADFDSIIQLGCSADTVKFINQSLYGDVYIWNFGDGSPRDTTYSRSDTVTHIYTVQNRWVASLIVFNGTSGCVDSTPRIINTLHPLTSYSYILDDTICQGEQVNFFDTSEIPIFSGADYFWDFGDGSTDTVKDPFHLYPHPGVYLITHTVTDDIPCSDTSYITLTVDSAGVMGIILDDSIICEGENILFTGEFTDIGLQSYIWNFGDGYTAANVNPVSHTYDSGAVYTVSLTGTYRACPTIDSTMLLPVVTFPRLDLGPDTTMCPNGPGVAIGDAVNDTDPTMRWIWSTGDTTSYIVVRHPGVYSASVSKDGCYTTDSVEIFKDCYLDIPNSFTPNNDGENDYFLPRQLLSKSVTKFKMQIFNRWGQKVFETDKTDGRGWDGKFNNTDQPLGVYVYIIEVEMSPEGVDHYHGVEKYQGNVTLIR